MNRQPEGRFSAAKLRFNANISFAFQAIEKLFSHPVNLCVAVICKCLGDIWEEIVLVKFREIRNVEDLM